MHSQFVIINYDPLLCIDLAAKRFQSISAHRASEARHAAISICVYVGRL